MLTYLIVKEVRENLLSLKGALWMLFAAILFSSLSYSFVTVKELSYISQVEMMNTFMKVVLLFGLLITLILAASSIASEKERGTLESLMLTPISKRKLVAGKWMGVIAAWVAVTVIASPYVFTIAKGTAISGQVALFMFGFGTLIIGSFTAVSLGLSSIFHSSKNAMILSIIFFLMFALPAFLSTTTKKNGFGKFIDTISPLSGGIKMMKNLFVNKMSIAAAMGASPSIFIFFVVSLAFLVFAVQKLTLLGGDGN
ncbi:ABC transporter permease [Gorillibacterium massiliense]|uniref:ABC transporter permease n=1 Tax=Gorillibacterium massiliense TaxID=1280390 RepID=UPI0004B3DCA7|nr:ABC transporter permease subunit [Gorillibacterium massiliense]